MVYYHIQNSSTVPIDNKNCLNHNKKMRNLEENKLDVSISSKIIAKTAKFRDQVNTE